MAKRQTRHAAPPPVEQSVDDTAQSAQDNPSPEGQWEGWYTPIWRTRVHCGIGTFAEVEAMILAVIREAAPHGASIVGASVVNPIVLDWRFSPQGIWLAYGSDGVIETNLPLARMEPVK
jgi:hypothetical protein